MWVIPVSGLVVVTVKLMEPNGDSEVSGEKYKSFFRSTIEDE